MPIDWAEKVTRSREQPLSLIFTPRTGGAFHFQITALRNRSAGSGFKTLEDVRRFVERDGMHVLAKARERKLVVEPLGQPRVGYFYALTDGTSQPDEYPLLTQGVLLVRELLLTFTFLHHERDIPERALALDMLAQARQQVPGR